MTSATAHRPFLKVLIILGLISLGLWVASFFPDLVITLIISVLAAFVLRPLVVFLEFRLGVRRSISIALVFVVTGSLLAIAAIEVVPFLIYRVRSMYDTFRQFPFDQRLNEMALGITTQIPFLEASTVSANVRAVVQGGMEFLRQGVGKAAEYVVNLAIVPFITYFILAEGDTAVKKLIERVPNKYFEMTLNVINRISRDLVGYLRGWILDSVIIGVLSIIGYLAIGVDYAILIGILAGVGNLIPYLGPVIGAVPAFLVSLTQYGDFQKAIPIIVLTFSVQLIDNTIVQPLCFSKTVDMHPVTVILVLLIGNTLMGVAGMLLAIPIATILKASAVETYWGLKNYRITA